MVERERGKELHERKKKKERGSNRDGMIVKEIVNGSFNTSRARNHFSSQLNFLSLISRDTLTASISNQSILRLAPRPRHSPPLAGVRASWHVATHYRAHNHSSPRTSTKSRQVALIVSIVCQASVPEIAPFMALFGCSVPECGSVSLEKSINPCRIK